MISTGEKTMRSSALQVRRVLSQQLRCPHVRCSMVCTLHAGRAVSGANARALLGQPPPPGRPPAAAVARRQAPQRNLRQRGPILRPQRADQHTRQVCHCPAGLRRCACFTQMCPSVLLIPVSGDFTERPQATLTFPHPQCCRPIHCQLEYI